MHTPTLRPVVSGLTAAGLALVLACVPDAPPGGSPDPGAGGPPGNGEGAGRRAPRPTPAAGLRISLEDVDVPTVALLQAVSAPGAGVVWLSGHEGAWLRSTDGGRTWSSGARPGGDTLQFRDVAAFGPTTAYLMSSGSGAVSRVYRTDDGGRSWRIQYQATDSSAFLSCMTFWDEDTGIVYGDEFDGTLFVLRTEDGGRTWARRPADALPEAQEGEGGFAASGTCAVAGPGDLGWIATGNAARARILTTEDRGRTWTASDAPVGGGTMAGLFTVAVDGSRGIALGGAVGADTVRGRYVALSDDGGRTWREGGALTMTGAAYGAALVPGSGGTVGVAVGPGGMDWTRDAGLTWAHVDDRTWWAVGFDPAGTGWAAGPDGRVARVRVADTGAERTPEDR